MSGKGIFCTPTRLGGSFPRWESRLSEKINYADRCGGKRNEDKIFSASLDKVDKSPPSS